MKSPVEKDVPYFTDLRQSASLYSFTCYDLHMLPHIFCEEDDIRMLPSPAPVLQMPQSAMKSAS
jgi:hypothetical protein